MVGKRVAFINTSDSNGSWAEYAIADCDMVLELDDDTSLKEAGCSFINTLTVAAMAEECMKNGYTSIVNSVACSNLGQMMYKFFEA